MNTPVDEWIAREALPFDLNSPETFNAAVDLMAAALGDAPELLGFGEALHGGEDILDLRNRLFQRLVEAHGYSAIAIESSFPRSQIVNEYVAGRGGATYDAVREAGFSHDFGALDANRRLVEWMRAVNTDPSRRATLRFYGVDTPTEMMSADSPRQALYVTLDYLSAIDADSARTYRERIDPLIGDDAGWENPMATMDPAQSIGRSPAATALRIETEDLIAELSRRRPELIAWSDGLRYTEALQYALAARQLLNYHAAVAGAPGPAVLLGMRDASMADNLAYIASRERGRGRVLVFAHNTHLQRGPAQWELAGNALTWWPAGAHLGVIFGSRYAVIGSGVGVSDAHGIGAPEPGTLEARLTAAPGPGRFIPTRGGDGLSPADVATLPVRSGSAKNPGYFPLSARSFTDFDWLAVLDSTG